MTFGERLNECMKQAGYTQKQLAEKLNITPVRLNYWIKDKRQPDIPWIKALSDALNVSTDYLIGNVPDSHPEPEALYISTPSGDSNADEMRRALHALIDQLDVSDLPLINELIIKIAHSEKNF